MYSIGALSRQSGVIVPTIRYYEDIGLSKPLRDANGYRAFRESDLHKLAFLGRARALGFSSEECRKLMALYEDKARASSDVKALAQEHLSDIESKIRQLEELRQTLSHLVASCAGDDRPDCPILTDLAQG